MTSNTQSIVKRRHKKADPPVKYLPLIQCFDAIIEHSKHSKALNYCVNYAKRGIEMIRDEEDNPNPIKSGAVSVQCLYILNNMTHWRGETATLVRLSLRHYIATFEARYAERRKSI